MHYYNEYDKNAAAWLRELIARKLIPAGEVDNRSIVDVRPGDLKHFVQCHFFAGIGGWPRTLQLAGWPEDKPVWTMSCPCQPFSTAGQGAGTADERHLWPVAFELVRQCRPPVVFGEQVASALVVGSVKRPVRKDGQNPPEEAPVWLDGVFVDLESAHYTCGAAVVAAASVGAPHIRQRLYWVAYDQGQGQGREGVESQRTAGKLIGARVGSGGADRRLANSRHGECWRPGEQQPRSQDPTERKQAAVHSERCSASGGMGNTLRSGLGERLQCDSDAPQDSANRDSCGPHVDGPCADSGMGDTRCQRDEPRRGTGDVGRTASEEQREAGHRRAAEPASSFDDDAFWGLGHAEGDGRQQRGAGARSRCSASNRFHRRTDMSTHWIKTGKVWSDRYHPPTYRPANTASHSKKKPAARKP